MVQGSGSSLIPQVQERALADASALEAGRCDRALQGLFTECEDGAESDAGEKWGWAESTDDLADRVRNVLSEQAVWITDDEIMAKVKISILLAQEFNSASSDRHLVRRPSGGMKQHRAFHLSSWLVRALVPSRMVGSYVLYSHRAPIYVGRSDFDVQSRLLDHAGVRRADYFSYQVHPSPEHAYRSECSLFHAISDGLTNIIHPDSPNGSSAVCEFCVKQLAEARDHRINFVH